jgi:hypothetical protein
MSNLYTCTFSVQVASTIHTHFFNISRIQLSYFASSVTHFNQILLKESSPSKGIKSYILIYIETVRTHTTQKNIYSCGLFKPVRYIETIEIIEQ